jgi:hypothetical protein
MASMQMADYVEEIRHAVESLVPLLWHEVNEEDRLHGEFHRLEAATHAGYRQAEAFVVDSDDPEDVGLATAIHWDTYFGVDKERHDVGQQLQALRERLQIRRFSMDALAGALLQIVKQGLSLAHGGLGGAPAGRSVGRQSLSTVAWQARNQAMHWEEGKLRLPVIDCFRQLEADFGAEFGKYSSRSLAFPVVRVLDWRDPAAVLTDLASLG